MTNWVNIENNTCSLELKFAQCYNMPWCLWLTGTTDRQGHSQTHTLSNKQGQTCIADIYILHTYMTLKPKCLPFNTLIPAEKSRTQNRFYLQGQITGISSNKTFKWFYKRWKFFRHLLSAYRSSVCVWLNLSTSFRFFRLNWGFTYLEPMICNY